MRLETPHFNLVRFIVGIDAYAYLFILIGENKTTKKDLEIC